MTFSAEYIFVQRHAFSVGEGEVEIFEKLSKDVAMW